MDLNIRVSLQARDAGQDALGQPVTTWIELSKLWIGLQPLRLGEAMLARQIKTEVTHIGVARRNSLLADPSTAATRRFVYGTRIFDIKGLRPDDQRTGWVHMELSEGLNNG